MRKTLKKIRERIIRRLGGYVAIEDVQSHVTFGNTTIYPNKVMARVKVPARMAGTDVNKMLAVKIANTLIEQDSIRITRRRDPAFLDQDIITGETMVYKPVMDVNGYEY